MLAQGPKFKGMEGRGVFFQGYQRRQFPPIQYTMYMALSSLNVESDTNMLNKLILNTQNIQFTEESAKAVLSAIRAGCEEGFSTGII